MMKIPQNAYFCGKMPFCARKWQKLDISSSFLILKMQFKSRFQSYFGNASNSTSIYNKFHVQQAISEIITITESTETGTLNL